MLAIEHIDDGAHLQIPIDIFDRAQLAALVDLHEPIAQALVVHNRSMVDRFKVGESPCRSMPQTP